jgi:RNA polymerase sigma factor (sigma-70 family)
MNFKSKIDDCLLWASYRKGDEKSFESLYDTYYGQLINYGARFTTDINLIEESIQDLYIKLWNKRSSVKDTPSVKYYLYKAFRRILIRKIKYTPAIILSSTLTDDKLNFSFELSPEALLMSKERLIKIQAQLQEALSGMTNRQREIIYLKFYEDISYEEISKMMNITVKGTYKLIYRALEALKDRMGNFSFLQLFWLFSLQVTKV